MLEHARQSLAGGASSPFRSKLPVPLFFEDASGARMLDVDKNEYIDYVLAWGPLILGHKHPALVEVLRKQAELPHNYGAQHYLESRVSEQVQALVPCAELVAFTSSGSEAVQCAMRLARGWTGRNLILKFEGHYHGWMDSALISYRGTEDVLGPAGFPVPAMGSGGQVPNALQNTLVAEWNDREGVERLFALHGSEIAAVISEVVVCNSGSLEPDEGFPQFLREITNQYSSLLIFDEVITGFRIDVHGAQAVYGVTPDLATFGKAIGGGISLSAIAGRRDVMEQMASGSVVFGGTFNGNPISLAAADCTIGLLAAEDGLALKRANELGYKLRRGYEELAKRSGIDLVCCGFGTAFSLHFGLREKPRTYRDTFAANKTQLAAFVRAALDEGVYMLPDGRIYVSVAHTEKDIDDTLAAAERVFAGLAG